MKNKVVYISGKLTDETEELEEKHKEYAKFYAKKIWEKGYPTICPHLNTDFKSSKLRYIDYLKGDFELIKRCDIIFMLSNWKESKGAIAEKKYAEQLNKKIIYEVEEL